jgi:hypothetical protein
MATGRWRILNPSSVLGIHGPCLLKAFVRAWVDTPNYYWLPNSASTASEWITPYDGESNTGLPAGWYVYRTTFPVPSVLPNGSVPTGVLVNGQLSSDNMTATIYMESPAKSVNCSLVAGQAFPVNPTGSGGSDYQQWWFFSFTNKLPIAAGQDAYLYFVVQNAPTVPTPTGVRIEFFDSSTFY